jgi:hypothetical protein
MAMWQKPFWTPRSVKRATSRPSLEALEDRTLLSTFTVINTADSGAGSLRQAILDANASGTAATIQFNIPGSGVHVISVAAALPTITVPVTINGFTQPGSQANTNGPAWSPTPCWTSRSTAPAAPARSPAWCYPAATAPW